MIPLGAGRDLLILDNTRIVAGVDDMIPFNSTSTLLRAVA